jgi:hypothetical protein
MLLFSDALGVLGVILILIPYILLQLGKIDSKDFLYSFINALGAFLILFSLFYDWNLASFLVESFWLIISLYGIWNWYKIQKTS